MNSELMSSSAGGTTPKGWKHRTLGECAWVNPKQLASKTEPDFLMEYLDISAIESPGTIGSYRTFQFADAPSRARRLALEGDILVSTVRPYLRGFARIREAPDNLVVSTGYAVVRPRDGVDGGFLYQHVLSGSFVEFLKSRMSGSNYPAVTTSDVQAYPLLLPPLAQQQHIAAILSSVDDAIEKTQAVIGQVQVVKRGLMEELLTKGLPGRHTHFKQTKIGKIPDAWGLLSLADLAEPNGGIQTGPFGSALHASDYMTHGVPVIMPKDLVNGHVSDARLARISNTRAKELHRHRVRVGDMLFARRGDIGRAGLITEHEDGWICGTGCFRFRPIDRTVSRFLRLWASCPAAIGWLKRHAVGQTMLNLNTSILGRLPVALPSGEERSAIADAMEALARQIETHERVEKGLVELKRTLLSVLLTGELRVTPDAEAA